MSVNHSLMQKMKQDFPGYAARFFVVKDKEGKIVPFKLNNPQMIIWNVLKKMLAEGKPIRLVVLKARQYGISTFMQAFLLWLVMTRQGQHALIIGQNLDMAGLLFEKAELMWEITPEWVRPVRDSKTRGKRLAFGGLNRGLLYVDTAENRDAGRSGTFQHVHCTEIPFWPDAKRTMTGLTQSVPKNPGTTIIVESTAHGEGDYFHDLWTHANEEGEGWNGWTPLFIPWFEHDEYEDEPIDGEILPEWIVKIGKKYDLSDRKLTFYYKKYKELDNDLDMLKQEYPCEPDDAFKGSGLPFFNRSSLDYQRKTNERKPKREGMYVLRNEKPIWMEGRGSLHVFEEPISGRDYVIGIDVSTGRSSDFSVLQVLKGMEQVASYRGKIDADMLADLASWVGYVYNRAMLVPERNGVGEACVLRLVNHIQYKGPIYTNYRMDTTTGNESKDYGFTMHKGNRMALLDDVNSRIRTGELIIRDDRTLRELERFVFTDESGKKAEAAPGSNDDMVMALALAVHVASYHSTSPAEVVYNDLEF